MTNRRSFKLYCIIATVSLVSCAVADGGDPGLSISVENASMLVTGCNDGGCSTIYMNVHMVNKSNTLYCVPSEYFGDYAAESLYIFERGATQPIERNHPSRLDVGLASNDEAAHVRWLRAQPNFVLQAGGVLNKTIYIKDDYTLDRRHERAVLQLYAYPCADPEFSRDGYLGKSLPLKVTFE